METFMAWVSFVGSWLLFAGSLYQAALELKDEDIEFDRIRAVGKHVEKSEPVSAWWWFLPPVKIHFERKMKSDYQKRYLKALSHEDVEALIVFRSKATAWLLVSIGGLFLATNETYTLSVRYKWDSLLFVLLVIAAIILSILNLIARMKRSNKMINL